ncbi:eight-cysteine-cluster domain-containing protein [Thermococcus sp. M39]|uniref:CGP-CTERM-anchored Cys-rich protein n=1 Tax=unclassified Thermococcus TaxID=2627626 RepID=UPI001439079A|nr:MULTISPECIES: CGP-CTERM-anchored Cys-rich protein [unclassified Thermococcus]NJE08083.1 eight-cysteine-cluster domain-containing protein [Thermococcus sp. M39]NJE11576.1 eight-cysteine-cluster domain-containing protein [Thermococcus sp. LS2]
MKRHAIIFILILAVLPFAQACFSPTDNLAVEVYFNKPGIVYNLEPLKNAENVSIEDGRLIYRSHYDERVAVMLWDDKGLHLRIEIPVKSWNSTYLRANLSALILVTDDMLKKAGGLGWNVTYSESRDVYYFTKGNYLVQLEMQRGNECSSDSDCAIGGCSGEICTTRENAGKVVSICVYKDWYECLKLTSCGCVNGICSWKPNSAVLNCLKEHGVDPSKILRSGKADVRIFVYNREELTEKDREPLNALFDALGIKCAFENVKFERKVANMPEGVVDPYTFNFKEALRVEIKWLKDTGILNISDEDIEEIVKVAKRGYAGYNSHIGWYETKDGRYAWIPYFESKDAKLLKCTAEPLAYKLPKGTVKIASSPTTTSEYSPLSPTTSSRTICGPAFLGLVSILPLIWRKMR